jgi:hypothetical protein
MLGAKRWPLLDTFRSPRASAEDEAAFDAYLLARVAIYGSAAALVLNVLQAPLVAHRCAPAHAGHDGPRLFRDPHAPRAGRFTRGSVEILCPGA